MPALALSLLGSFQLTLDGRPVAGLVSNKVRGLLAYLAVEADQARTRDSLAGLFWPERPERVARANLRSALANLRHVLGDAPTHSPLLITTRGTAQLDLAGDALWLDTAVFARVMDDPVLGRDVAALERTVALYRGDFLEGLSTGSAPFEEWVLICREQYSRRMLVGLEQLSVRYESSGDPRRALACARRQLDLAPWDEGAHQHVIRLLADMGERSAALAQYETCRRVLAAELDAEPAAETTLLAERIRHGAWPARRGERDVWDSVAPRAPAEPAPPAPGGPAAPAEVRAGGTAAEAPGDTVRFVGRTAQLQWLHRFLAAALEGHGWAVFVTGEAGSGKTALVAELGRQALAAHPDLLVAWGRCSVHAGRADPYLPFADILRAFTGDVEGHRPGGQRSLELDRRLLAAMPEAVQALLDAGPDLAGALLSAGALARHIQGLLPASSSWIARLEDLARRPPGPPPADLLAQFAAVLRGLACRRPLVIVLDDLHWADNGSISLLYYLARQLAGTAILLIGIYRPAELLPGRGGRRPALARVVNELQHELGEIRLDLEQADGRQFVDDVLDAEPNHLRGAFRDKLYRRTGGHALFTVELLRALRERGDLQRNDDGLWVEGPALDWGTIPLRVEAMIAESIARLPAHWQALLSAASVEGEEFSVETLAQVVQADKSHLIQILSGPLSREHRVVEAAGLVRVAPLARPVARYRFRHALYRSYLYHRLDCIQQAHLHGETGLALAALYGDQAEEIAAALSHHFEQAGDIGRAVDCCLQAAAWSARLGAYAEALAHLNRGLALLAQLPDSRERARREIRLQLALDVPLQVEGWQAPERERAVARAYELSLQVGDEQHVPLGLPALAAFSNLEADYAAGQRLGLQLLDLAQRAQDPLSLAVAHQRVGVAHLGLGDYVAAREHLEQALVHYRAQGRSAPSFVLRAGDNECVCQAYLAAVLGPLGYVDQARERGRQALAAAEALDEPLTLANALMVLIGPLLLINPEDEAARAYLDILGRQVVAARLAIVRDWVRMFRGLALVVSGEAGAGLELMHAGLAGLQSTGAGLGRPLQLILLARAYGLAGQPERGLAVLDRAQAMMDKHGARYSEAELHRLRAELMLAAGPWPLAAGDAEASLQRALEVARQQEARGHELRAVLDMARLWQRQGRAAEAADLLAGAVGRFPEGLDPPHLAAARALINELRS